MKTSCAVILCALLLLVSACAQKINDPADVQAIKKSMDDYVRALNLGDAEAVAAIMTDKTVYADLNMPVAVGKDAIRSQTAAVLNQVKCDASLLVEDVHVAGDQAIARGAWTLKMTPKAQGIAGISDGGSYIVVLTRQNDGTWKWDSMIANSNQPLPGSTASGAEEETLIRIEEDWMNALVKSDAAAFEHHLAKEWTFNSDGQVSSKAQVLAEIKSGAFKITSIESSDLKPHVFGDVAFVTGTMAIKGTYKGSDMPSPQRSTDFFVKRDGQWQAVNSQNVTVK
jgi:uncharacterized protein (TIGR02246 family)